MVSEQSRNVKKGNNKKNVDFDCLGNKICNSALSRKSAKDSLGKKFQCLYFNARSIVSFGKRAELEMYVQSIDPICISITET